MEIRYDKDADAIYIEFTKGEFDSNKKIDNNTIADYDKDGNLLGIELLSIKKRFSLKTLSEISVKNLLQVAS